MDESTPKGNEQQGAVKLEPERMQHALGVLRDQQNLFTGVLAAGAAAILGAGVWAFITVMTEYQIGWMAIGVGFLVGLAVRKFGKGIDKTFGFVGAGFALLGCVLGNLLAICGFVSVQEGVSFLQVVGRLTPSMSVELLKLSFNPMDILFYGLAIFQGYKLSFRQITRQELEQIVPEVRQQKAA